MSNVCKNLEKFSGFVHKSFIRPLSTLAMVRTFWVVRHAEREDNINHNWIRAKNPRKLKSDNSPLSTRGQRQADELGKRFKNVPIDHVFASPFDRTIETATRLIGDRNIPIKVEPGLAEALYLCENPPGFEEIDVVKRVYPLVDADYEPIFKRPMPREGYGDDACVRRLRRTLDEIVERYPEADSIVLVGHGASIGAVHEVLADDWQYVGQATVSKFTRDDKNKKKFRLEFSSDSSHMSDKSNLRPY